MRIRVKDVLDMLAAGVSEEEILQDYPDQRNIHNTERSQSTQSGIAATKETEILEQEGAEVAEVSSNVRLRVVTPQSIHPLRTLRAPV